MRAVISKSMMLGLALAAMTGCNSETDKSTEQGSGQIQMNVALASGATITSVHWALTCSPTAATVSSGDWAVNDHARASGAVGGLPLNDTCSLVVTGTDSWGTANNAPNNCSVTVSGLTPSAGAKGTLSNINLSCNDGATVITGNGNGHVGTTVTVSSTQTSYQCASVTSLTATPVEVYAGDTIALTSAATTGATVATAWSSDAGTFSSVTSPSTTFTCTSAGMHTITLAVTDLKTGTLPACSAVSDTIDINCVTVVPVGTGGAPGTGGASATGGSSAAATGGASATGGSSAAATGGAATGGTPATGGAATGGTPATGGAAATGGTTAVVEADLAILNAQNADCGACALSKCGNYMNKTYGTAIDTANGFGSCMNTTVAALNQAQKVGTYQPTSITPTKLVAGVATNGTAVCLDVLSCVIKTKCAAAGVASKCYCGDAIGTDCVDGTNYPDGATYFASIGATTPVGYALDSSGTPANGGAATGPIDGACFIEEIDGRNNTGPTSIAGGFGNSAFALGPANQLVTCLLNNSCSTCFN